MPELILDTNILLAYVRQGAVGMHVESQYSLWTCDPIPIISVVAEGELRALALQFGWGLAKLQAMEDLVAYFTVIPLPFEETVKAYAQIDSYSRRMGIAMGKNDVWIAATAHMTGARLLTTDRDFDHLHGVFIERDWIDPATVR